MPWKNGRGVTSQIAVAEDSSWRLSAATISEPGPFSEYPGFRRLLAIWKGDGLLLNEFKLNRGEVYDFSGETPIFCQNLSPVVVDVGLIFDPRQVTAKMFFRTVQASLKFSTYADLTFLFCASGSFVANGVTFEEGDTLSFSKHAIELNTNASDTVLLQIEILRT